jgi:hypothetical protein
MPLDGNPARPVDNALAVFDRMLALLSDPKNWGQKQLADGHGRLCIGGAFTASQGKHAMALTLAREASVRGYGSVPGFNDAPGRTHAEILEFITAARRRYEREATHAL